MLDRLQEPTARLAGRGLPRIVFVLGKGGVGRSTCAAALAVACARRGERTLIVQWAVADVIGPWFGHPPVGATATPIAPRVATTNFALDEALRAYFVDHLHFGFLYRRVIRAPPVTRLLAVAPGLAEMFFLGQLWWLDTLAAREARLEFDRIIVDAPATGHGTSILDVPTTLAHMDVGGLLATETTRVVDLMADPERTGAVVVTLAEPLVIDETRELIERLSRPPLAVVINRSVEEIVAASARPPRPLLAALYDELAARDALETELRTDLASATISMPELPARSPRDVVAACAEVL